MAMHSDMDILMDMTPDKKILHMTLLKAIKTMNITKVKLEHILKSIDTTEHYFHFVNTIFKRSYRKLTDEQKKIIQTSLGIQPKIVEKVVVKKTRLFINNLKKQN